MLSIVYVSSATTQLSEEELVKLLEDSRVNNERLGITGMLLYKGGNFMQVIEGEDAPVQALYAKISADPRHRGVVTMSRQTITQRQFAGWAMGFQNVDKFADAPGFSSFLTDSFTAETYRKTPNRAYKLLLMFRDQLR